MGVDIYGKRFANEREAENRLIDEIGFTAYMEMDPAERPFDRDAPGRYFLSNWYCWRPIVEFIHAVCDDEVVRRCTHWGVNYGDGLDAENAKLLGDEVLGHIASGEAAEVGGTPQGRTGPATQSPVRHLATGQASARTRSGARRGIRNSKSPPTPWTNPASGRTHAVDRPAGAMGATGVAIARTGTAVTSSSSRC